MEGRSTRAWPGTGWIQMARRRLGRRHGWRRTLRPQLGSNVRGNGSWWRNAHSPVKRAALPPLRPRARGNPPRRGHGGSGDEVCELEVRRKRRAKGPASPPGLRCARAGVHACARASRPARTRARTRTRTRRQRRGGDQDGWLPTARGARLGRRRARVGEGGGTCKKSRPSLARWPASPAAARRHGSTEQRAFCLGSKAVASTRGEKRASSPRWPLAEVERVSEVRRCGLPARKKRKQATTRRRGGRGSSGSRRSRRVRLLPRVAPVFAAYSSPAGGSSPPPPLLHPLLLRQTMWAVRGDSPGAARVWGSLPGSTAVLNRAARLGTRGRPGCTGARGTPRRRASRPALPPPLPLGVSQR
jgi:hypothetical protein